MGMPTHLSAAEIEEFGREMDAIRNEVMDSRGEREPLRRSSLLDDGVGPVLTEVSASSRNVQSPVEQSPVEEWLATSKGGFVRSPDCGRPHTVADDGRTHVVYCFMPYTSRYRSKPTVRHVPASCWRCRVTAPSSWSASSSTAPCSLSPSARSTGGARCGRGF